MSLAGGCANKNLIRLGGGSLRSLVVLCFLAISAYMTLKGLFGQWRATRLDPVAIDLARFGWKDQGPPTLLAAVGIAPQTARWLAAGAGAAAARLRLRRQALPRQPRAMAGRFLALGALVVGGWYVMGTSAWREPETLETGYFGTNTRTL